MPLDQTPPLRLTAGDQPISAGPDPSTGEYPVDLSGITQQEFDAEWKGLPPGQAYIGLDSKPYRKRQTPVPAPTAAAAPVAAPPVPANPLQPPVASASAPALDTLDQVINTINRGETGGYSDPYHTLYGGGHFGHPDIRQTGPGGLPTTAAGQAQWQVDTWDRAVKQWMAANPKGGVPDFDKPEDQRKIQKFWASYRYKQITGRDLASDAAAGIDWRPALAGEWPSLRPRNTASQWQQAGLQAVKDVQAGYARQAADYSSEANELIQRLNRGDANFQEQMKLVRRAQERAFAAQDAALEAVKNPPHQPDIEAVSHMGSLAAVVGVLGGLLTKMPMRASINGLASALSAYNAGDLQKYKIAYDNWKTQTDMLFGIAKMQAENVRDIMSDTRMEEDERSRQLDVLGRAMGLNQFADQARTQGSATWANWLEKQDLLQSKKEETMTRLDQTAFFREQTLRDKEKADEERGWTTFTDPKTGRSYGVKPSTGEAHPLQLPAGAGKTGTISEKYGSPQMVTVAGQNRPVLAQQAPGGRGWVTTDEDHKPVENVTAILPRSGAAATPMDDKTIDYIANMIASYRMAPLTGFALRTQWGPQVMAKVSQIAPDYDATHYAAKLRAEVAFTSGRQGDTVRSFSVAIDHLHVMEQAADALNNGDVRALNAVKNYVLTEFGYEGPIDFNFVKTIVGDEVAKAVIGGVGASIDREKLQNGFNAANSPEQIAGVAREAKRLMAGQLQGLRRQGASAGYPPSQFDAQLSPIAKKELEGVLGPTLAPSGAVPPQPATVPPGSQWSPSRRMWRDRNGRMYNEQGAGVQ